MKQLVAPHKLRVESGKSFRLRDYSTKIAKLYSSDQAYSDYLATYQADIDRLQQILMADDRYALLVIFQGMDTAGKDGAIKHVMSGVSPSGCQVFSFKRPSDEDLDHDFMWRCVKCLPERGRIGIFNRSYYEDVLIARVHPEVLEAQRLPIESHPGTKEFWRARYGDISGFEQYLNRNGTRVLKIFLHISKSEQAKRLIDRCTTSSKQWKYRASDFEERKYWDEYMHAYDRCIKHTASSEAPWHVIPADDKRNARLMVSQLLVECLKSLPIKYPKIAPKEAAKLKRALQGLKKSKLV